MTKRCPSASGGSHEQAGCAPQSAPKLSVIGNGDLKNVFHRERQVNGTGLDVASNRDLR